MAFAAASAAPTGRPVTRKGAVCAHCPREWPYDLTVCSIKACSRPICALCRFKPDFHCIDCRIKGQLNVCVCPRLYVDQPCGFCACCFQAICRDHAWVAVCEHDNAVTHNHSFWNKVCTRCRHREWSTCRICTDEGGLRKDTLNVPCLCRDHTKPCRTQKHVGLIDYYPAFERTAQNAEPEHPRAERKRKRAEKQAAIEAAASALADELAVH